MVGGQFGSESKGATCAMLAKRDWIVGRRHVAVRIGGSQAGHTAYDKDGNRWALRHVPVAAVVNPDALLVIGRGSEIDPGVLQDEVKRLEAAGHSVQDRLLIDESATVIEDKHKHAEADGLMTKRLGSTAKGVGAARADRIWRLASTVATYPMGLGRPAEINTAESISMHLVAGAHVVIEGVQGYGLGLHTRYYPKCTSSDADAITFLAMAGVSPWAPEVLDVRVLVVVRPYPIRVAGDSGPLEGETTWEALGLEPEYTTVTQKVRRVGQWDPELVRDAVQANGGPSSNVMLAVGMVDQVFPEVRDRQALSERAERWLRAREDEVRAKVYCYGTGPDSWHLRSGPNRGEDR